jgi:hypothetical protein
MGKAAGQELKGKNMAHVESRSAMTVSGEAAALKGQILDHCLRTKMALADGEDLLVVATQGTQLGTRLLGGWFVPARWLPKKVTVSLSQHNNAAWRVRVHWEDTLGFGIMDPLLRKKYEKFFDDWMDDLFADLKAE